MWQVKFTSLDCLVWVRWENIRWGLLIGQNGQLVAVGRDGGGGHSYKLMRRQCRLVRWRVTPNGIQQWQVLLPTVPLYCMPNVTFAGWARSAVKAIAKHAMPHQQKPVRVDLSNHHRLYQQRESAFVFTPGVVRKRVDAVPTDALFCRQDMFALSQVWGDTCQTSVTVTCAAMDSKSVFSARGTTRRH